VSRFPPFVQVFGAPGFASRALLISLDLTAVTHAGRMQRASNLAQDRLATLHQFRYINRLCWPDVLLQDADELVLGEQWRPPFLGERIIIPQIRAQQRLADLRALRCLGSPWLRWWPEHDDHAPTPATRTHQAALQSRQREVAPAGQTSVCRSISS
jgi:hypothetical protein